MTWIYIALFSLSLFEVLNARQTDVDINRLRLVNSLDHTPKKHHSRATDGNKFYSSNAHVDYSGRYSIPRTPMPLYLPHTQKNTAQKTGGKVYQPKEDPRFFYLSDSYIKETGGPEKANDVSWIYPGREVVRAGDEYNGQKSARLTKRRGQAHNVCVRCPHDRTLIAKGGSDRVLFQSPRLIACSGRLAPRNVHFIAMYGPKFGSLIERGSHMVVGRIVHGNRSIQHCKMQVHVITQGCSTPKHLTAHCERDHHPSRCNFTCQDERLQLRGDTILLCGEDSKWLGELPVCVASTWCDPPAPPDHGHVSCQGDLIGPGGALAEGSKCRVRCHLGWRSGSRVATLCRRGVWTKALSCQKRNSMKLL